jgi:ribonuclease Z
LREEARAVFGATEVPRDFDTIEIPFPERGAPRLVHFSALEDAQKRPEAV